MSRLGARELDACLDFALQAQATDDLRAFREELVPALRRVVACDTLGYNEIDLELGTAVMISDALVFDGIERRFLELASQHPLVPYQRAGDVSARLISDFLSVRAFHRLELYQDIYRPLGIEDQLAFGLPGEGIVAINLGRGRRTFTERDRELLELVREHMALAYMRARERDRTRALIEALESGLHGRSVAVIQLDRHGRVARATTAALELLEAYFGSSNESDRRVLPLGLADWLGAGGGNGSRGELRIDRARGRLRVREQPAAGLREWRTLVLEERRASPPSIETLRSLGLTARQAQVLRLLACGKQTRHVAAELQISTATVSKHLEHIYQRLGVSTRAEAVARIDSY